MFDKPRAMKIQREVIEALQDYATKNQLKIDFGGGQLGDNFTLKLRIGEGDPQIAEAQARKNFAEEAFLVGLKPEDYGRKFRSFRGETYTVCAIDLRKRKYPILALRVGDGKRFKFPESMVVQNWVA